jgi:preprotein translocase subunit SecG
MLSVVVAIHLMLVLALIVAVLLQRSEGAGLVSSTSGFMTGRGTANALTRTTALLAAGFFATSLILSLLASHSRAPASLIPGGTPAQEVPGPGGAPLPTTPLNSGNGGLLNQLGGGGNSPSVASPPAASTAPSAPAPSAPAPSGPQVPQSR